MRIVGSTRTYQRFANGHKTGLTFPVIGTLARLFNASIDKQAELERLWDLVDETSWLQSIDAMTKSGFHAYIELERLACRIISNETMFVHGLLQLESFMRELFARNPELTPSQIDEKVQRRLQRQKDFENRGEAVSLEVILGENVLRLGCPSDQLGHLIEADERPNIAVNYLPFEAGPTPGLDVPFHILSFTEAEDLDLAYFDAPDGARYIELPKAVADFHSAASRGRLQAKSIKEFKL